MTLSNVLVPATLLLSAASISHAAQTVTFLSDQGSSSHVSDALNGVIAPDHLNGNDYNGFVGEMLIMPADPGILSGASGSTRGLASSNPGGAFEGRQGFIGFCIDSETTFRTSSSLSETFDYQPLSFEAAEARYQAEAVSYYLTGGLKRAAYMMETFFDEANAAGDLGAGALQIAIWGTLYDSNPDVSPTNGNYYVRNNIGSSHTQSQANEIINLVNGWYSDAAADNWGGTNYDPNEEVVFWMDPDNANVNQSVITLMVDGIPLTPVPEPGIFLSLLGSLSLIFFNRKRRR